MAHLYRLVLVAKLVAVVAYGGGLAGAFLSSAPRDRARAVHGVASPALLVVWGAGCFLASQLGVALTELWLLAALALSVVSLLALVHSVARERRTTRAFLTAAVPLVLVLVLMVFRPTWEGLRGS